MSIQLSGFWKGAILGLLLAVLGFGVAYYLQAQKFNAAAADYAHTQEILEREAADNLTRFENRDAEADSMLRELQGSKTVIRQLLDQRQEDIRNTEIQRNNEILEIDTAHVRDSAAIALERMLRSIGWPVDSAGAGDIGP